MCKTEDKFKFCSFTPYCLNTFSNLSVSIKLCMKTLSCSMSTSCLNFSYSVHWCLPYYEFDISWASFSLKLSRQLQHSSPVWNLLKLFTSISTPQYPFSLESLHQKPTNNIHTRRQENVYITHIYSPMYISIYNIYNISYINDRFLTQSYFSFCLN